MKISNKIFTNIAKLFRTDTDDFITEISKWSTIDKKEINSYIDNLYKHIYDYDLKNGVEGQLYCIHNEMYDYYGKDVYKLGMTFNMSKRMGYYTTSYLTKPTIILKSKSYTNYKMAEKILFYYLRQYRIKQNREFFKCSLDIIKHAFNKVKKYFKELDNIVYVPFIITNIKLEVMNTINNNCENMIIKLHIFSNKNNDKLTKNKIQIIMNNQSSSLSRYIKDVFQVETLKENFLECLKNKTNIDKFYKSTIYFANKNYKDDFFEKYNFKAIYEKYILSFRQAELIKGLASLYWSNNLFDKKTIKIYTGRKGSLNKKEKKFIKNNEVELRILFKSLKRKTKPKYSYQVLKWLQCMVKEYFGNFILINISNRKDSGKDINRAIYYYININQSRYIELILHKNTKMIDIKWLRIIKSNYSDEKCKYNELHDCKLFKDLIVKKKKYKNMFIDSIDYFDE